MSRQAPTSIESKDLSISDLFKDFYSVPDFQREYVWERENVERLLQDSYDEFYDEANRPTQDMTEYFIGSVVVCPADDGTYQLIDGQQRLTTIYLTLCAIRDYLTKLNAPSSETLTKQIAASSLNPRSGDDVFRYRLTLQYEDSDGVLEKIASAAVSISDIARTTSSVAHILTAYEAVREFLTLNFGQDAARIKAFLAAFTLRVKLIRIITPSIANALKVFETINDRGIGLNAMDLLKNLLFMRMGSEDYGRLKGRWKTLVDTLDQCGEKPLRFLRYYIISQYETGGSKILREDEIYDWLVKNAKTIGIDEAPLTFVDDLVAKSRAYANFITNKDPLGEYNRYLRNITLLAGGAVRQHFVLLLAGMHLPQPLFTELCRQIENMLFCYLIIREPTKVFEQYSARWAKGLRTITSAAELEAFINHNFRPEITSRAGKVDFALGELAQSRIQQYRLRYVLAKFTQFIEEKAWGNPVHAQLDMYFNRAVHIEHILSQTPTAEARASFDKPDKYASYAEKLGNLTLLERTINTSVSNDMYEKKKPGYRQSQFLLTKSLVEQPRVGTNTQLNRAVENLIQFDVWNSEAIEKRQHMLVQLARDVWQIQSRADVQPTS